MPDWMRQVINANLFAPRAGGADLRAVGLDFDDDLGGLTKRGPSTPVSRTWLPWAAVAVTALLIMAHPAYGLGVLHGVMIGGVATMIWVEPGMAYGRGYK